MRRNVVWTEEATWDLTHLGQYVMETFGLPVASKVTGIVVSTAEMLSENPYMGVALTQHPPYRVFHLKFSSIYYIVRDNEIEITRLLDNRQSNSRKKKH